MADSTTQAPKRTRKPRPKARSTVVRMPTQTPFDDTSGPQDDSDPNEALPDTSPASKEAYTASQKAFPPAPRGTGKGGYCKDTDGMLYWQTLPSEFQNRLNVYVNREWPVLNRIQELTADEKALVAAKKRREPYKYIDKPAEPFGPDTRQEFLQRYGSGIYKVFINDAGVKGAPRKRSGNPRQETPPEPELHCRTPDAWSVTPRN
jgi:hypothetical protein